MAKLKDGINRSAEIRKYLGKHPSAKPKEIVTALARRGIDVSTTLVSVVKYSKRGMGGRTAGGKTAAGRSVFRSNGQRSVGRSRKGSKTRRPSQLTAGDLFRVKQLTDSMGGIDEARQALDALEQLR